MSTQHRVSHRVAPAALLFAALAGGCVWNPVDFSTVDSRYTPIDVTGYASVRGTRVQLRGWNFERNEWEPLRVVEASDSGIGRDHTIYPWSSAQLAMGERYWMPPGANCRTGGMGRLQVREWNGSTWGVLHTFNQGGRQCVLEKIAAGEDFVAAGVACYTGDNILLFSHPECIPAAASDSTPPTVILRATDDEQAWEVTSASASGVRGAYPVAAPLRLRVDAFDPEGPRRVSARAHVTVSCRGGDGLDRIHSRTLPFAGDQVTTPGSEVERSVGAWLDIDRARLQALCEPGRSLVRASITATASGETVSGASAATPAATFEALF